MNQKNQLQCPHKLAKLQLIYYSDYDKNKKIKKLGLSVWEFTIFRMLWLMWLIAWLGIGHISHKL